MTYIDMNPLRCTCGQGYWNVYPMPCPMHGPFRSVYPYRTVTTGTGTTTFPTPKPAEPNRAIRADDV